MPVRQVEKGASISLAREEEKQRGIRDSLQRLQEALKHQAQVIEGLGDRSGPFLRNPPPRAECGAQLVDANPEPSEVQASIEQAIIVLAEHTFEIQRITGLLDV